MTMIIAGRLMNLLHPTRAQNSTGIVNITFRASKVAFKSQAGVGIYYQGRSSMEDSICLTWDRQYTEQSFMVMSR
ncbi:hypothetical protein C8J55DRAFT_515571, partial [Lentinula edodes]